MEPLAGPLKQKRATRQNVQTRNTSRGTVENPVLVRKVLYPETPLRIRKKPYPRKVLAENISYRAMDFRDPRMGNIPRNIKSEARGDEFLYQLHLRHIKEGRNPYSMKIKSKSSVFDPRKGKNQDMVQNVEDLLKGI